MAWEQSLEAFAFRRGSNHERCILTPARNVVRPLFLPLFDKIPAKHELQMNKEKQYFKDFWDPNAPLYPELSHHKKIREHFTSQNRDFEIFLEGKPYKMSCLVIESKSPELKDKYCNIVHVLGINSTINNCIMHTYPLLASYLDAKGEKSPARFILINHYSLVAADGSVPKPQTLTEAGLVLSETLKTIESTYGKIHQVLSFSLGGIITAAALKYFPKDETRNIPSLQGRVTPIIGDDKIALKTSKAFKSLPLNFVFDRVPSSTEKLSDRYSGGAILLYLAKLSGWDINIGKEISHFISTCKAHVPNITIVNALQDHRFYGEAGLYSSPEIRQLVDSKKITALLLDITQQSIHENAQHSYSLGHWYGSQIVGDHKKQTFLRRDQSLSDAIIQQALHCQKDEVARSFLLNNLFFKRELIIFFFSKIKTISKLCFSMCK